MEAELTDIVDRLKSDTLRSGTWADTGVLMLEAAEEIERLRSGGIIGWAITDTTNEIIPSRIRLEHEKDIASFFASRFDPMYPDRAPHSVIRVRIVPDTEEQK
jgi:hypothetical protein